EDRQGSRGRARGLQQGGLELRIARRPVGAEAREAPGGRPVVAQDRAAAGDRGHAEGAAARGDAEGAPERRDAEGARDRGDAEGASGRGDVTAKAARSRDLRIEGEGTMDRTGWAAPLALVAIVAFETPRATALQAQP